MGTSNQVIRQGKAYPLSMAIRCQMPGLGSYPPPDIQPTIPFFNCFCL